MPSSSCHMLKCLLPSLNLSVDRAANADVSYQSAGLQANLQRTWDASASSFKHCCLLPLALKILVFTAATVQCSSYEWYSLARTKTVLGLGHFGDSCLCNLAVNVSLCASFLRIVLTEHWIFSSLHSSSGFWQGKT